MTISEIKHAAFKILARREYSRLELLRKLSQKFPNAEQKIIAEAIEQLIGKNFQNDERFAKMRLQHRAALGYGPNYIKQELRQQGLSDNVIQAIIAESEIDWYTVASLQYQKHFRGPIKDNKDRAKRMRYLYSRGFSQEMLNSIVCAE